MDRNPCENPEQFYPCCVSNEKSMIPLKETLGRALNRLLARVRIRVQTYPNIRRHKSGVSFSLPPKRYSRGMEAFFMNRKTGILAVILILFCIAAGIIYTRNKPETTTGEKEIHISVVHADKSENTFTYRTDAEYLAEVLLETGLAEGDTGEYGLFITAVDGETADSNKQQWWCITKGGERVNSGADTLPVVHGDQFELTLMEGY